MTVRPSPTRPRCSHGPKVIPPSEIYDTARYGDRPFPVVPVQYTDRAYQATHSGELARGASSTTRPTTARRSTSSRRCRWASCSPNGTVPSDGIATADFAYAPGFDFTQTEPSRATPATASPTRTSRCGAAGTPLYPERITNGVYNLPGQTELLRLGLQRLGGRRPARRRPASRTSTRGCGDTGKLVYDAAAIADPEIDYSDYDTDKDGVVDFFMVVFAGCGGNGGSQLAARRPAGACPYGESLRQHLAAQLDRSRAATATR